MGKKGRKVGQKQSKDEGGGLSTPTSSPSPSSASSAESPISSSSSPPVTVPPPPPTGTAASASFPYIGLPSDATIKGVKSKTEKAEVKDTGGSETSSEKTSKKERKFGKTSSSTNAAPFQPKHHRLSSLSSRRPQSTPEKLARAREVLHDIIRRQSLERGVQLGHDADVFAENAPWRTDDTLASPELYEQYKIFPQVVDALLEFGDASKAGVDLEVLKEFYRYISLAQFGQLEQNAWQLFKRICRQKKDSRAVVWLDGDGSVLHDWTFGSLYSRVASLSLHLKHDLHVAKGSRALLCFVPGLDFFVAFWACLSQGIVAVPVTPVDPFNPKSDVAEKLSQIVASCSPSLFLTTQEYMTALDAGRAYLDSMAEGEQEQQNDDADEKKDKGSPFDVYTAPWLPIDSSSIDYSKTHSPFDPLDDVRTSGLSLAFLQYTSGSTGAPKGVMVGHTNIVANVAGCTEQTRAGATFDKYRKTVAVSWLPTFHDMGLMGFHIAPLLTGTPCVYFSPLDFLRTPLLWLRVLTDWTRVDKYGYEYATTGGPPFALDLIVKKLALASEEVRAKIDLRGVLSIILGAEPIRAGSLLAFASSTAELGFSPNAFMPAYGLAENVLHVAGKKDNTYPPTLLCVDQTSLNEGKICEVKIPGVLESCGKDGRIGIGAGSSAAAVLPPHLTSPSMIGGKWLVSCGELYSKDPESWPGMRVQSGTILVVNPVTMEECPDGQVGELWITGKCVTAGYWNNAAATTLAHSARIVKAATESGANNIKSSFYRTGDLGAFYKNELYITGRLKEMIIVNGTKHYPMDIEESIRAATANGVSSPVRVPVSGENRDRASISHPPPRVVRVRPGGILAAEVENAVCGKHELVVMVELQDPPPSSGASQSGKAGAESSSSSGGGMSSSHVKIANMVFKHCQKLPESMRAPTIKFVARWGAKIQKYTQSKNNTSAPTSATASASSPGNDGSFDPQTGRALCGHDVLELEAMEKAVRRAVIGRFGIPVAEVVLLRPRSILKTSSGKIRRTATVSLLVSGQLESNILRRSSDKKSGRGASSSASAAAIWQAKPTIGEEAMNDASSSAASASDFEIVGSPASVNASSSPPSKGNLSVSSHGTSDQSDDDGGEALDPEEVKRTVVSILAEELQLDSETVLLLSSSFRFDEGTSLDEYGLDSLTAMKIAGRLTSAFKLSIPISPFMFFSDPTLDGMCEIIRRLKKEKGGMKGKTAMELAKSKQGMMGRGMKSATPAKNGAVPRSMSSGGGVVPSSTAATAIVPDMKKAGETSSSSSSAISASSSSNTDPSRYAPFSSPHPFILGIGHVVPGPGAPQSAIMDVMISDMELPPKKAALFAKIGESAGIDRRYSVLPSIEAIYFGRKGLGNNENVEVRNAIFKSEAPALSLQSARAAIAQWGGNQMDLTHVVAVTCTGVIVPGLEFQILSGLGLSSDTQRLSVTFMGCFGALSGMKAARAFAMESPHHRVLLVCTELCSLHMQLDDRIDNLVGSALFADGSAAMIIGAYPREGETPIFEMHGNGSYIIENTKDMMAWELTMSGMSIGLGKEIPDQIYRYIDSFSASMLCHTEAQDVKFDECIWALHPGGPMILTAIADRLGLSSIHTAASWKVLRQYGNMSSATLIFVLAEIARQFEMSANDKENGKGMEEKSEDDDGTGCSSYASVHLPPNCSPFVPALAFGPGLNVEGCLLKYVRGKINSRIKTQ